LKFGNEEEIGKTMSPAKAWFDKLTTLRKIEGQRRQEEKIRSTKFETISNDQKKRKFKTSFIRIRCFGFSEFGIYFGLGLFRISIFGFWILFHWRLGEINFPGAVRFNISKVSI
jgi:hypothetical protein